MALKASVMIAVATLLLSAQPAFAQTSNPLSDGARHTYDIVKNYITRAEEKMPESDYSFKPTPEVRSFGQLIGHLADANAALCSVVAQEKPPIGGVEKTNTSKADLIKSLADAFAYCDAVHAKMTDAAGTAVVKFVAGGPTQRRPEAMPKLSVLEFNTHHDFEHYGNIVTYLRLKGLVPPSSEPPPK